LDINWTSLRHAYGPAGDIPGLLAAAAVDSRPGHEPGPWFDLWSALCHQGDAYSASLAAVPLLVRLAPAQLAACRYDAVLLAACIEQARLEGRAPEIPAGYVDKYSAAIAAALSAAESALPHAWNTDAELALRGSIAVFRGDLAAARAIFEQGDE
jgi:hypothetical protein